MGLLDNFKKRVTAGKFQSACLREAGDIQSAQKIMDHAISAIGHLTTVIAHADREFVGDNFIPQINGRIFAECAPDSLSDLFYKQAQYILETERTHYSALVNTMPEKIRAHIDAEFPAMPEDNKKQLAEVLMEQSLRQGDHFRTLGEALQSLSDDMAHLSPYLQREMLKPHAAMLVGHKLIPEGISF